MNITILYSLPTDRLSDSPFAVTDTDTGATAQIIKKFLEKKGHNVSLFPLSTENPEEVVAISGDCVFNLIEWTGSDLPAAKRTYQILDEMRIPYTGAEWEGYVLSSEKTLMKRKFREVDIQSPVSFIVPLNEQIIVPDYMKYPLIVKLASDHCSIGLERDSVVSTMAALKRQVSSMKKRFNQDILVEEFITGKEYQITAIEVDKKILVLPPTEIIFYEPETLNFLTFGGRWLEDDPDYEMADIQIATDISPKVWKTIQDECLRAFSEFHLHDYARFDIRVRGEDVYFLEVNANPGLDETLECGVTLAADAAGISFEQLLDGIVVSAEKRKRKEFKKRVGKKVVPLESELLTI